MFVLKAFEGDKDTILDLGDGREIRIAFKGAKRVAEGKIEGKIGILAPSDVKILFPGRKAENVRPN